MDPTVVGIPEINLVELSKALALLIVMAAVQTAILDQFFAMGWFKKYLGEDSRWFKNRELRPWISLGVAAYVCFSFSIQFPGPKALVLANPTPDTVTLGILIAAGLIGGGTKLIKKAMKDATETVGEVADDVEQIKGKVG